MPLDEASWTADHTQAVAEAFEDSAMRLKGVWTAERSKEKSVEIGEYGYLFPINVWNKYHSLSEADNR